MMLISLVTMTTLEVTSLDLITGTFWSGKFVESRVATVGDLKDGE